MDAGKSKIRSLIELLWLVIISLVLALLIFEGIYRSQIIDTYASELHAFNPLTDFTTHSKPTLLVMGDSFTAGNATYAHRLQTSLPQYRVINSGVSGTGIIQTNFTAKRRFKQFQPTIFIYQIYVGNDLFDIRYPFDGRRVSLARRIYWWIANYFRCVSFLNYRLGQIILSRKQPASDAPILENETINPNTQESFSIEKYDSRIKIYFQAEPTLVAESILVQGNRKKDYQVFLKGLEHLVSYSHEKSSEIYFLVIPHACQVDSRYRLEMTQLGAERMGDERLLKTEYPFISGIRDKFKSTPYVHVINPLEELRKHQSQVDMYLSNNEHLSLAGQKVIADVVLGELKSFLTK